MLPMKVSQIVSRTRSFFRPLVVCGGVLALGLVAAAAGLQAAEPLATSYRLVSATETELLLGLGTGLVAVGLGLRRLLRG
jgi:hypothetical protein